MIDAPDDRGAVSLEMAIVGSAALIFFFSLLIVAGRVIQAENDVRSAAQAAARAASLQSSQADAAAAAEAVALENLSESGAACEGGGRVQLVASGTDFQPGGRVTVEVACTTPVLPNVGLAGPVDFDYRATEVIDVFLEEFAP